MVQTRTTNAGPVAPKPKGAYDKDTAYETLDVVLHDHDSWVCIATAEDGSVTTIKGQDPAEKSPYWKALTDGGRAAYAEGETAKSKGNAAEAQGNEAEAKGNKAEQQGNTAETQGKYAENQGNYVKSTVDEASRVNAVLSGTKLSVTDRNGSTVTVDTKGEKGEKGEGIDYTKMSASEKEELASMIAEEIALEGGYTVKPVDLDTLTASTTFEKNSIICIDGIVYIANKDTENLPFKVVTQDGKLVTQTMYGETCIIVDDKTLNSDWRVWIDASNSLRLHRIEERVTQLESIISSMNQ